MPELSNWHGFEQAVLFAKGLPEVWALLFVYSDFLSVHGRVSPTLVRVTSKSLGENAVVTEDLGPSIHLDLLLG